MSQTTSDGVERHVEIRRWVAQIFRANLADLILFSCFFSVSFFPFWQFGEGHILVDISSCFFTFLISQKRWLSNVKVQPLARWTDSGRPRHRKQPGNNDER